MREQVIYKFMVEYQVFDISGNSLYRKSKPFETKKEAEEFALKLKRSIPDDNNINVRIRQLDNDEVIRVFKKVVGRKNYRRIK